MFHAKDDPNVPYERTSEFAEVTGAELKLLNRVVHISTDCVVRKYLGANQEVARRSRCRPRVGQQVGYAGLPPQCGREEPDQPANLTAKEAAGADQFAASSLRP
jgi:hypothetical protein